MSNYDIPIMWQSVKTYPVEADNLQEAVEKALKQFFSEPDQGYLEDSFEVDDVYLSESYPEEKIDYNQAYNSI